MPTKRKIHWCYEYTCPSRLYFLTCILLGKRNARPFFCWRIRQVFCHFFIFCFQGDRLSCNLLQRSWAIVFDTSWKSFEGLLWILAFYFKLTLSKVYLSIFRGMRFLFVKELVAENMTYLGIVCSVSFKTTPDDQYLKVMSLIGKNLMHLVLQFIHHWGLIRNIKKPFSRKGNRHKRFRFAKWHKNWTENQWRHVLWSDESSPEPRPQHYWSSVWSPWHTTKGCQHPKKSFRMSFKRHKKNL